jgi:hypothetical protein
VVHKRPSTLQVEGTMRSFLLLSCELIELSAHPIITSVHLKNQIVEHMAITSKEGHEPG